jgi:hypothetical protein
MSIEQLGSIGEFVAALGVIISLLFVGLQLRRSSMYAEFSQTEARATATREWQLLLVQNEELAEIWRKGCRDPDDLSSEQRFRFGLLFNELFFGWERTFIQAIALGDKNSVGTVRIFMKEFGTHQPGIVQWWARVKHRFNPDYQALKLLPLVNKQSQSMSGSMRVLKKNSSSPQCGCPISGARSETTN